MPSLLHRTKQMIIQHNNSDRRIAEQDREGWHPSRCKRFQTSPNQRRWDRLLQPCC